jgi:hypothetical protein
VLRPRARLGLLRFSGARMTRASAHGGGGEDMLSCPREGGRAGTTGRGRGSVRRGWGGTRAHLGFRLELGRLLPSGHPRLGIVKVFLPLGGRVLAPISSTAAARARALCHPASFSLARSLTRAQDSIDRKSLGWGQFAIARSSTQKKKKRNSNCVDTKNSE